MTDKATDVPVTKAEENARSRGMDYAATFCIDALASMLGVEEYRICDGTEEWEGDVRGTLWNILVAADVINEEDGAISRHRTASEQPASGEVIEAAAWIVGDSSGTRWRTWSALGPDWTEDREKATRYARREDAEQVHEADDEAWRVQRYIEPALSTTSEAPEAGRLREALEDIVRTYEQNDNKGDDDWEDGYEDALAECARIARAALSPPCEGAE